jgi:hypothetical protein
LQEHSILSTRRHNESTRQTGSASASFSMSILPVSCNGATSVVIAGYPFNGHCATPPQSRSDDSIA